MMQGLPGDGSRGGLDTGCTAAAGSVLTATPAAQYNALSSVILPAKQSAHELQDDLIERIIRFTTHIPLLLLAMYSVDHRSLILISCHTEKPEEGDLQAV